MREFWYTSSSGKAGEWARVRDRHQDSRLQVCHLASHVEPCVHTHIFTCMNDALNLVLVHLVCHMELKPCARPWPVIFVDFCKCACIYVYTCVLTLYAHVKIYKSLWNAHAPVSTPSFFEASLNHVVAHSTWSHSCLDTWSILQECGQLTAGVAGSACGERAI